MSNISKAHVKIQGTRPYFFHSFSRDSIPLGRVEKAGKAGNNPEEWRKTVSAKEDGQLFIKHSQVFATIRDGARYTKKGRTTVQKDMVAVLLVDSPEEILIDRYMWDNWNNGATPPEEKSLPVYLDIRGVVNPSTRGRNVRYRVAMSPGWEVEFDISWDATIIGDTVMESVLIDAGRMCGLGNGRAIGMGRFEIVSFEID